MALYIFALRLAAAFVFGIVIGAERERHQRTAGIRTNTLLRLCSRVSHQNSGDLDGKVA